MMSVIKKNSACLLIPVKLPTSCFFPLLIKLPLPSFCYLLTSKVLRLCLNSLPKCLQCHLPKCYYAPVLSFDIRIAEPSWLRQLALTISSHFRRGKTDMLFHWTLSGEAVFWFGFGFFCYFSKDWKIFFFLSDIQTLIIIMRCPQSSHVHFDTIRIIKSCDWQRSFKTKPNTNQTAEIGKETGS